MRRLMMGLALMCLTLTLLAQDVLKEDSLQEVVVTGTGTQHLLKDAPVQTEVITGQMLKNFSGSSIADILSGLTASFAFSEDDMGSQMQLNGLGNSYILVLIDGKRIHGDVGGQNDLSLIDPQNIEKIEIVKGASSPRSTTRDCSLRTAPEAAVMVTCVSIMDWDWPLAR